MKNYKISETIILNSREDLFYELYSTGDVTINDTKIAIFDVLYFVNQEEIENVFSMLIRGNDDAKDYAIGILRIAFDGFITNSEIEDHVIDEACEL